MRNTDYIKESQDIIKMAQFPKMQQMWASCHLKDALKTIARIGGSAWASNMHIIAVIILSLSKWEAFRIQYGANPIRGAKPNMFTSKRNICCGIINYLVAVDRKWWKYEALVMAGHCLYKLR